MPAVTVHAPDRSGGAVASPLPALLRTPLGLAIVEIQGTLNLPVSATEAISSAGGGGGSGGGGDSSSSNTSSGDSNGDGDGDGDGSNGQESSRLTRIGRLEFPLLAESSSSSSSTTADSTATAEGVEQGSWMSRVHLYVGEHQRLVGEVRKLERAVGVLRRRQPPPRRIERFDDASDDAEGRRAATDDGEDELEIADVVRWKLFFGGRPEFV